MLALLTIGKTSCWPYSSRRRFPQSLSPFAKEQLDLESKQAVYQCVHRRITR